MSDRLKPDEIAALEASWTTWNASDKARLLAELRALRELHAAGEEAVIAAANDLIAYEKIGGPGFLDWDRKFEALAKALAALDRRRAGGASATKTDARTEDSP